jgi:hypothetical protein
MMPLSCDECDAFVATFLKRSQELTNISMQPCCNYNSISARALQRVQKHAHAYVMFGRCGELCAAALTMASTASTKATAAAGGGGFGNTNAAAAVGELQAVRDAATAGRCAVHAESYLAER